MDLYDVLGVTQAATPEEIKLAYKRLASKLHPDKNPDDPEATANFQALQHAYSVLSNPQQREQYDLTGEVVDVHDVDASAKEVIAGLYSQHAKARCYMPRNYLVDVEMAIQKALTNCQEDKKTCETSATRLQYLIDNTAADEVILDELGVTLNRLKMQITTATRGVISLTRALELIAEYKYTGESDAPWDDNPHFPTTFSVQRETY